MEPAKSIIPKSSRRKICLSYCRYDVLSRVAMECGFKLVPDNDLWNIIWSDAPLTSEKVFRMRRVQVLLQNIKLNFTFASGLVTSNQRMNHFPGMYEICRKNRLGRNLNRLKKLFPNDYNFFPTTWDLPSDISDLMDYWRKNKNSTFIIKPDAGCQGKGIFLVKNLKTICPYAKWVCQLYMSQPFLIDGYKYDQRIYVLITCVDPLRIYVYNEGIARLATVKYASPNENNLDVILMHLTNYSLNKMSESYDESDGDGGSKRKLSDIYACMAEQGHDVQALIDSIDDIIVKTVLCALPTLRHSYRTSFPKRDRPCACFEILGFDILVDRDLRPFLVEVNHTPSFSLDLPVDNDVKTELLKDTLSMIFLGTKNSRPVTPQNIKERTLAFYQKARIPFAATVTPTLLEQFAHEAKHLGNFRLIFEEERPGVYSRFLDKEYCMSVFEEEYCMSLFDESEFMKKRRTRLLNNPLLTWPNAVKLRATLNPTKTGLTCCSNPRPHSAGASDHQEFTNFKFNAETSPYFNEYCKASPRPNKKGSTKRTSNPAETIKKDVVEKIVESESTCQPDGSDLASQEQESQIAEECVGSGDISNTQNLALSSFNPSQRIQAALDILRQKNMEEYKLVTQFNDGVLRSSTSPAAIGRPSPYLEGALRLQQKGKKLQQPRNDVEGIRKYFKPSAKLYKVLQQYALINQTPWIPESQKSTNPPRIGPVTSFIQQLGKY